MLEVFLNRQAYPVDKQENVFSVLVHHLVQNGNHPWLVSLFLLIMHFSGFYSTLRSLVEARVPCGMGSSVNPPTPLAASLLALIRLPLSIVSTQSNSPVMRLLCTQLFCRPFSEQMQEFLMPALAYGSQPFPFVDLLHTLLPLCQRSDDSQVKAESFEPSVWLLYAVLTLADQHLGGLLSDGLVWSSCYFILLGKVNEHHLEMYLRLLQSLIPSLQEAKKKNRRRPISPDEESSSEEEIEFDPHFQVRSPLDVFAPIHYLTTGWSSFFCIPGVLESAGQREACHSSGGSCSTRSVSRGSDGRVQSVPCSDVAASTEYP